MGAAFFPTSYQMPFFDPPNPATNICDFSVPDVTGIRAFLCGLLAIMFGPFILMCAYYLILGPIVALIWNLMPKILQDRLLAYLETLPPVVLAMLEDLNKSGIQLFHDIL